MPILTLGLGGVCDYRCIFCSRGDNHYFERTAFNAVDEYEKAIKQLYLCSKQPHLDSITISRDEPINHPFILNVVRFARKVGFKKVVLSTAGMGLKNRKFLAALVKAGVTSAVLPVYGVTPGVHDGIVGLPGAHGILGQVTEALGQMKIGVKFSTIVLKQNLHEIEAIVKRYGCPVTFPYPTGSRISYESLCPKLSEIPKGIRRSLNLCIPCITGKVWKKNTNSVVHIHTVPMNLPLASHRPSFKPGKCRACAMLGKCEGVFRKYAALYGSGEFKPLPASGLISK